MKARANGIILFTAAILALGSAPAYAAGAQDEAPAFEDRFSTMAWDEIVAEAEGQSVFFYMWGGSEAINRYVTEYLGDRLEKSTELPWR